MSARVGPVLRGGAAGMAVRAAIVELNDDVRIVDRGAYVRVEAAGECVVTREAIERHLGDAFELPGDLERIMPSFSGRLHITDDEVRWA